MSAIRHTVKVEVEHRQWLQTLDEAIRIIIEDYAPVQQTFGVEYLLEFAHYPVGLIAPLIFYEWRHVATRAVFSLQATIVVLDHQLSHIAHHLGIACHLVLIGKALVQDKVIVALECVAIYASIVVAMIGYQLLQFHGSLRQRFYRECHILYQARCAHRTRTAYTREDATADGPVLAIDGRILSKFGWDIQAKLTQALLNPLYLFQQLLVGYALGLSQYCSQVVIVARLHARYLASIHILLILQIYGVINRRQRLIVQHLGRFHHQVLGTHLDILVASLQFLHGHHSLATLLHREEVHHCRGLEGIVLQRLHRHLGKEGQCTFGTDNAMRDDVERVVVSHQWAQVQSCNILDAILFYYTLAKLVVSTHLVTQTFYTRHELRM